MTDTATHAQINIRIARMKGWVDTSVLDPWVASKAEGAILDGVSHIYERGTGTWRLYLPAMKAVDCWPLLEEWLAAEVGTLEPYDITGKVGRDSYLSHAQLDLAGTYFRETGWRAQHIWARESDAEIEGTRAATLFHTTCFAWLIWKEIGQ